MDTLEGTAWVLISLNGSSPLAKTTITAQFAEGRVSGSAGCNSYQGSYAVEESDLSIAELLWTEMACLDLDGFMEQESIYTDQLARATGYRIADDQLEIFSEGDRVLIYAPQPEEADVGLEGTTWSLTTFVQGETATSLIVDTEITAIFEEGQINASAGCNTFSTGYEVDGLAIWTCPAFADH